MNVPQPKKTVSATSPGMQATRTQSIINEVDSVLKLVGSLIFLAAILNFPRGCMFVFARSRAA